MCNSLLVCWQNPTTRGWQPIGRLSYNGEYYSFSYTQSAQKSFEAGQFFPLGVMDRLDRIYKSETLFPIFNNRLLTKSRPEYSDYLGWLGFEGESVTDMDELSRSGGIRATDNLQLFPIPEKNNDDYYSVQFFAHGVRHFTSSIREQVQNLHVGDRLYLMKDVQNPYDKLALILRTDSPPEYVGYCPSVLAHDFNQLLDGDNGIDNVEVTVSKINPDSPLQYSLLCEFRSPWVAGFQPFMGKDFEVVKEGSATQEKLFGLSA